MRVCVVWLAFILLQSQFGSEQIKSRFESKLQPYFPNAKVILQPAQHGMIGLTCVYGAGPELAHEAASMLNQELGSDTVTTVAIRAFLTASGYRSVAIGFDKWIAVFDLPTRTARHAEAGATYQQSYEHSCGR